jgi:hypothetical protein
VATFIESTPIRRISLEKRPIIRAVSNPNIAHPPLDPAADLATHLAEAVPAQFQLR